MVFWCVKTCSSNEVTIDSSSGLWKSLYSSLGSKQLDSPQCNACKSDICLAIIAQEKAMWNDERSLRVALFPRQKHFFLLLLGNQLAFFVTEFYGVNCLRWVGKKECVQQQFNGFGMLVLCQTFFAEFCFCQWGQVSIFRKQVQNRNLDHVDTKTLNPTASLSVVMHKAWKLDENWLRCGSSDIQRANEATQGRSCNMFRLLFLSRCERVVR